MMLLLLLSLQLQLVSTCQATVFGTPGDKLAGGRTLAGPYPQNIVGVAHRTAPMGSYIRVTFLKEKMHVRLKVVDRGPWGKTDANGKWWNACPGKQCAAGRAATKGRPWRGCLDIAALAAQRLGLPPHYRGTVKIEYKRSRKRRRKW